MNIGLLIIIPIDELIFFQRGGLALATTNQLEFNLFSSARHMEDDGGTMRYQHGVQLNFMPNDRVRSVRAS